MTLSKYQKRLIGEIKEIQQIVGADISSIEEYDDDGRTPVLEQIKQFYIRSEVISDYVFADEMLGVIIKNHFFDKKYTKSKYKRFNYFVLEKMYLIQKLDLVDNFLRVPKLVQSKLYALNDVRNGMAHSFFPELRHKNKPMWDKKSIYVLENFKKYREDINFLNKYLMKKAFDVSI